MSRVVPFAFLMTAGGGGGGFPVTDDPDGWWRADFASPWSPTASAGTSGANGNLTVSGAVGGTAVNGKTPGTFDGTNDFCALATAAPGDVMSVSTMTMIVLAKASAASAPATDFYDDEPLISSQGGNHALVFTSSGVRAGCYDGSSRQTVSIAVSTGVWFMAAARFDKTGAGNVKCRVCSAGSTTDATPVAIPGTPGALGADLFVGKNYAGVAFLGTDVLEVVTYKRAVTDAALVNWKSYFNSRYGLSL